VTDGDRRTALRARLEAYYDAVPRPAARVEACGPFTLFVGTGPWPYYARPRLGLDETVTVANVLDLRERQRSLGVPEQVEWQVEVTPSLTASAEEAGLLVERYDLMVLATAPGPAPRVDAVVRLLSADEDLNGALAAQSLGFGGEGEPQPGAAAYVRERVRDGRTVVAVATAGPRVVSVGMHQPVGDTTEVVGVSTVPDQRGRGLASAVTAQLVRDARERGLRTIFLTAADPAVASLYARLGFRLVGSAAAAAAPGRPVIVGAPATAPP
jgi:ribosomal protein S18 acetylase RimI-like enzyme